MPKIPAPNVANTGVSAGVRSAAPAPVFQTGSATADAFGALEGKALAGLGQSVAQASTIGQKVVDKYELEVDERASKAAAIEFDKKVLALNYGDGTQGNTGFMGLTGQSAIDAGPSYTKELDKVAAQGLKGLSPRAARAFQAHAHQKLQVNGRRVGAKMIQEIESANDTLDAERATLAQDSAGRHYDEPEAVATSVLTLIQMADATADRKDLSPEGRVLLRQSLVDQAIVNAVAGAIADKNFARAQQLLASYSLDKDVRPEDNPTKISFAARLKLKAALKAAAAAELAAVMISVRDAVKVAKAGGQLDGEGALQEALSRMGTRQANQAGVVLDRAIKVREDVLTARQGTWAEQTATATAISFAKPPKTVSEVESRAAVMADYKRTDDLLKAGHALTVGVRRGIIQSAPPVDFNSVESVQQRRFAAGLVADALGLKIYSGSRSVNLLLPNEAAAMAELVEKGTGQEVERVFATLAVGAGKDMLNGLAGQIKKKVPALAQTLVLAGNPVTRATVGKVVEGLRALKDNPLLSPRRSKEGGAQDTGARAIQDEVFGTDTFTGSSADSSMFIKMRQSRNEITAAADAIYAFHKAALGDETFDEDLYKSALTEAAGGIITFNTRKTVPPPGQSEEEFTSVAHSLTYDDMVNQGNGAPGWLKRDGSFEPLDVSAFKSSPRRGEYEFHTVSPGRYLIYLAETTSYGGEAQRTGRTNGGYAFLADGVTPYVIDLNSAIPRAIGGEIFDGQ